MPHIRSAVEQTISSFVKFYGAVKLEVKTPEYFCNLYLFTVRLGVLNLACFAVQEG